MAGAFECCYDEVIKVLKLIGFLYQYYFGNYQWTIILLMIYNSDLEYAF